MTDLVPTIDLAPFRLGGAAERLAVARQVGRACEEIGFLLVGGHGVPEALIDGTYAAARAFFDLPREEKARIRRPGPAIGRGWVAVADQALSASLFGAFGHWRSGNVDRRLAAVMSGVIFIAALAGGAGSKWFSHRFLLGLFLLLSLAAAVMILLPQPKGDGAPYAPGSFSAPSAVAIALGIGLLGGLVGQGGSFILIPMAVALLRVPLRIAMGSNTVIIFFASLAGFLGKAATGQIPLLLAGALLAGILPGSLAGVALSRRVSTGTLRIALGVLILAACARMALDIVR